MDERFIVLFTQSSYSFDIYKILIIIIYLKYIDIYKIFIFLLIFIRYLYLIDIYKILIFNRNL